MKIAIAGSFPEDVRARIQSCFPAEWDVRIAAPHTAGFPDGPGFHRKRFAFFAENIRRFWAGEVPEGRMNLL